MADDPTKEVHEIAGQLPTDATWDDVFEQTRVRKAVQKGIAAADRGG